MLHIAIVLSVLKYNLLSCGFYRLSTNLFWRNIFPETNQFDYMGGGKFFLHETQLKITIHETDLRRPGPAISV